MTGKGISGSALTRQVVKDFYKCWALGDIGAAARLLSETVVYVLHIDAAVLAFGGQTCGKAAVTEVLARMREDFDFILYRPFPLTVEEKAAHGQVEFIYRHRQSGQSLSGRCRLVWEVEDGLIVRWEEFHDAARIKSFMRLVRGEYG